MHTRIVFRGGETRNPNNFFGGSVELPPSPQLIVKIVIFAHVPPPHHGQSAMVRLMLDGLGSGRFGDFEIFHVDARFSQTMEEVGSSGLHKVLLAFKYAFQAIRLRVKEGVTTFYYIPAPPKTSAMVRDWIVLALCRPFFPKLIFHWHAVGLGQWTEQMREGAGVRGRIASKINGLLLGRHGKSLSLTKWGRKDSDVFSPRCNLIVPNGIPDPCPDFDEVLLPRRERRRSVLKAPKGGVIYSVVFIGHCNEGKGLWDAVRAIPLANQLLSEKGIEVRLKLKVAGEFPSEADRSRFDTMVDDLGEDCLEYVGFVGGEEKREFFERADCLCFPTKYEAESFGLVAAEALAFGLPAVCSDWRMLPDLMKAVGLPVAETGNVESLAHELVESIGRDDPVSLRRSFCEHFSSDRHLQILSDALRADEDSC